MAKAKSKAELLKLLLSVSEPERLKMLRELNAEQAKVLRHHWRVWARSNQLPPDSDWRVWLIMAGRGFGKTRAGAEWIRAIAEADEQIGVTLIRHRR